MNNKFNLISHNIRTRGNNSLLMLPKDRTKATPTLLLRNLWKNLHQTGSKS